MRILVTGAAGMLGQALVPRLLQEGHEVVALVRDSRGISFSHPKLAWETGDIRDAMLLVHLCKGVDRVAHLAARKNDEADSRLVNVGGTKALLEAAEAADVKGFVYISTISTKFEKRGVYAETKREAEELVRASTIPSVIIRPSVIYTDFESGILGSIRRYAKLPFLPVIGSGTPTYRPIHADDAAEAIALTLARMPESTSTYDLGGPDELSFNELARMVSATLGKERVRFLHIPLPIARAIAEVLARITKRPPITVSNVIGAGQDASVDMAFATAYGFTPRSLKAGLKDAAAKSEREETEPYVLLRYVLPGMPVSSALAERYEAALTRFGLPPESIELAGPGTLRALDAITRFVRPSGIFQRKLLVAAALAECSPASSSALLPRSRSLPALFFLFARAGIASALALAHGVILFMRPSFKRNA